MTAIFAYLRRCGIEFDIAINVLTGGNLGETVSYRSAVALRDGRRWGCVMCWFLNWAVQRSHCADQFDTAPMPWFDMLRAGIAFATAGTSIAAVGYALFRLL